MARSSGRIKQSRVAHNRGGVLRDRSASRAPSEGIKQVRIRSPTPIGLPPSLNDIVGEASPERANGLAHQGPSSPIPFPSLYSTVHGRNVVTDEVPESLQARDFNVGSTVGTSASAYSESDGEDSLAMFIVGECEHVSTPPSPSGTHSASERSVSGAAAETDEEIFPADIIVGEATGDNDPLQPWPFVPVSDDSSQSGGSSGSHTSSPQHIPLIIGEADGSDGSLADWDTQSEDEGTPVSSPSAGSNVSSPRNALMIVGEADDSDLDSPPQSSTSQSDRGMGESSSDDTTTTGENSDDPDALAKNSLTLIPVPGADDTTIRDLSFDFSVEASSSSPAHPASHASTQANSSPPDSANLSSSFLREVDVKVNAVHRLSQLRAERQEVADALEEISIAEETALALQSSAFSTHPKYWRAYQLSLWIRTAEVNNAWDDLVRH